MKKFFCLVLSGFMFCACSFFEAADERNDVNSISTPQTSSCVRQIKIVPSIGSENFLNASTRSAVAKISAADKHVEHFKDFFKYQARIVDTDDGSVLASNTGAISLVEAGSFSLVFSYPDFNSAAERNISIKIYGFRSDLGAVEIAEQMAKAEPESSLYAQVNATIGASTMFLALSQPVVFIPGKDKTAVESNGIKLAVKLPEGASKFTYSIDGKAESSVGVSVSSGYAIISRTHTEANPLPSGIHDVTFYVKDSNYNVIYFWTETVYVYYRLCTNVWNTGSAVNENIGGENYSVRDVSAMVSRTLYVYGEGSTFFSKYGIQKPADESESSGSIIKPFLKVQSAIEKILLLNDGTSDYNVYVDGTFTALDGDTPVVRITSLGKDLNLTIRGIGTTESTKAVLSGGASGGDANPCVVQLGTPSNPADKKLVLKLANLNITNGGGYKDTESYGGGIYSCLDADSVLTLDSVTVSGNRAAYGGGIVNEGGTVTLPGTSVVSQNISAKQGGGIYVKSGNLNINCTIKNNVSEEMGNGLYIAHSAGASATIKIMGTAVTSGNIAALDYICDNYGEDVVDERYKYIRFNKGLANALETTLWLQRSINHLGSSFTMLYLGKTTDDEQVFETVTPIMCVGSDGFISTVMRSGWSTNTTANKKRAVIRKQKVDGKKSGVGLAVNEDEGGSGGWSFVGIAIEDAGTGMQITTSKKVTLNYVDIRNCENTSLNSAKGGGIYIDSTATDITCSYTNVTGNKASYGAGIYVENSSNLTFENCSIYSNSTVGMYAMGQGGGICIKQSAKTTLTNCIIKGNSAYYGGGIYTKATELNLNGCSISLNKATDTGGGIFQNVSGGITICDANTVIGDAEATEAATSEEGKHSNKAGSLSGGVYLSNGTFENHGKIIYNYAEGGTDEFGSCGGIYNSMGTIILSDGAIRYNSTKKNKCGIVSLGTIEIKNDAVVDEVHLSSRTVKITGTLSGTSPVATISLPSDKYVAGTQVLSEGTAGLIAANYEKFKIKNDDFCLKDDGKIYGRRLTLDASFDPNDTDSLAWLKTELENYPDAILDLSNLTTMPVLKNCSMKKVVLPAGITSLPGDAFYNCNNLTEIDFNGSEETITQIGNSAFYRCGFETVDLTPLVNLDSLGGYSFAYCENLVAVKIPASVNNIGSQNFINCNKLKDVYVYGSDTRFTPCETSTHQNTKTFNRGTVTACEFSNGDPDLTIHIPSGTKSAFTSKGWRKWQVLLEDDIL